MHEDDTALRPFHSPNSDNGPAEWITDAARRPTEPWRPIRVRPCSCCGAVAYDYSVCERCERCIAGFERHCGRPTLMERTAARRRFQRALALIEREDA